MDLEKDRASTNREGKTFLLQLHRKYGKPRVCLDICHVLIKRNIEACRVPEEVCEMIDDK